MNAGIKYASGLYFKVVDSDDWVKKEAYLEILNTLRSLTGGSDVLDMMISNFVYEKEGERRRKVMQYRKIFPQNEMFSWDDCHIINIAR